jgi:hypothetical protein
MTIVHYDYRPKRAGRKPVEFPCGRIVSARKPKPRHPGEIREGVPDEAQLTELLRQFMERALKPFGSGSAASRRTRLPQWRPLDAHG